jgi:hypothetical protein
LRLDGSDGEASVSESEDAGKNDWEPRQKPKANDVDDLVVHVMIDDEKEEVIRIKRGEGAFEKVDDFVNLHGLSASKRNLIIQYSM